jgi:hypothetical protein
MIAVLDLDGEILKRVAKTHIIHYFDAHVVHVCPGVCVSNSILYVFLGSQFGAHKLPHTSCCPSKGLPCRSPSVNPSSSLSLSLSSRRIHALPSWAGFLTMCCA